VTHHSDSISQLWDSLVSSALLGTERRPVVLPPALEPVGRLLARLDPADSEGALLAASAIVSLHRRAARLPAVRAVHEPSLPEPCQADDLPPCSSRAGQHLGFMLKGQYSDLLAEWLERAAQCGKRAPAEHLPGLLDLGLQKADLRDQILLVAGKRGRWLAAQNSLWEFAAGDTGDESLWQTGTRPARLALLRQMRRQEPDRAREVLASTWAQETPEDRATFLALFKIGLSMADEAFLEEALDDRRKEVRRAAADLLACLPESRLCARTIERVGQLVKWRKGSKPGFVVSLPEECDKDMQRDGVEPRQPQAAQKQGEKSWWLSQMLGVVPLAAWRQWCNTAPDKIVAAAGRHTEWSTLLLQGLIAAATRHADLEWIEALLQQKKISNAITLFQALPADKKESHVLKLLSAAPSVKYGAPVMPYLFACRHPWSTKLSKAVMEAVVHDLSDGKVKYSYQLASLFELIARHLIPSAMDEVLKRLLELVKPNSAMAKESDKFLATLQFRQEMLKAIQD
jgi:hypothetical protein